MTAKDSAPLQGVRVIDATGRWGELAGRMLAELGAEVFKFSAEPVDEEDPYWASVRAGKIVVAGGDPSHCLQDADILLESGRSADYGSRFPRLIHVSITPFGITGPLAAAPAAEVTVEAAGGLVGLQGDADRPPTPMGVMPQAAFHVGAQAAADAVIALCERERSGLGQHLDVSAQACIVWTLMNATGYPPNTGGNPPATSEFRGRQRSAAGGRLRLPGIVSCKDGLAQVRLQMPHIGERTFDALLRWAEQSDMDVPPEVRGLNLNRWLADLRNERLDAAAAQTAADLVAELLTRKTKQEIQSYAAAHGLTLAAIHTVADLLQDPHLHARNFWIHDNGRVYAGPFAGLSRTPLSSQRAIRRVEAPPPRPQAKRARLDPSAPSAPFAGLKVADFSWVGVGPMIGKALADHGATVVRIEAPHRLDLLRTIPPFKDGEPGPDRAQFMANFNTSKKGMTLDLKNPEGRALARRMADWADVVLESFSPGTMARFGLDWATLSAERDDLVMLSTSMRGQTGPERGYSGFGSQGAAIAGLFDLVGWPDRPPSGPWGAYTDFIAPRFGIAALASALLHRQRTGHGQHIDLAQVECGIRFLEPLVLDYSANGKVATRLGIGSSRTGTHGVFQCAGTERYVALATETEAQHQALEEALCGQPPQDWCRCRDAFEAAGELRRAGVPAYVVMRPSDLYQDQQLAARRFFVTLDHPVMGQTPYDGPATIFSRTPAQLRSPAPCLGQHNEEVLREALGLEAGEIERLRSAGALG